MLGVEVPLEVRQAVRGGEVAGGDLAMEDAPRPEERGDGGKQGSAAAFLGEQVSGAAEGAAASATVAWNGSEVAVSPMPHHHLLQVDENKNMITTS